MCDKAPGTYWVLRRKSDGRYLCRNGEWCWVEKPAKDARLLRMDTSREAHDLLAFYDANEVCVMRRRKPKPDRLILTGEAARLVREWRALQCAASLRHNGWPVAGDMLAALAGEEVLDG